MIALEDSLVRTCDKVSRLYRVTLIHLNYTYHCNGSYVRNKICIDYKIEIRCICPRTETACVWRQINKEINSYAEDTNEENFPRYICMVVTLLVVIDVEIEYHAFLNDRGS